MFSRRYFEKFHKTETERLDLLYKYEKLIQISENDRNMATKFLKYICRNFKPTKMVFFITFTVDSYTGKCPPDALLVVFDDRVGSKFLRIGDTLVNAEDVGLENFKTVSVYLTTYLSYRAEGSVEYKNDRFYKKYIGYTLTELQYMKNMFPGTSFIDANKKVLRYKILNKDLSANI